MVVYNFGHLDGLIRPGLPELQKDEEIVWSINPSIIKKKILELFLVLKLQKFFARVVLFLV